MFYLILSFDKCVSDIGISEIGSINGSYDMTEIVMSTHEGDPIDGAGVIENTGFGVKVTGANPFNPSTTLNVVVPMAGHVSVKIYNIVGQEVATLADGYMAESFSGHTLNWNASNLASGVYLVRAEAAGQVSHEKLMLLK